jgi:chorismate dehydratase
MKLRVSLVHYLNSAPLGWAFLHGPFRDRFEVIPASPAQCADQLSAGEADIGLIPSIEYQRIPDLQILPEISISSIGKVRSILLVKPRGQHAINSVAMDTSSRTSVALAKVLLQAKAGVHPEYVPYPPDLDSMLGGCDAALLIGDPALRVDIEKYDVTDLAEEWVKWQQKPFVCAFWACRPGISLPKDLNAVFLEAKNWGKGKRAEIASFYAGTLNLPASFLESYLYQNIDYDMSPEHIEGLVKFYQLAKQEDLISRLRPLQFIAAR